MEKILKYPNGNFVIEYVEESRFVSYKGINPIAIRFIPDGVMQPYEALRYANDFSEDVVKEAKMLLEEHGQFYKAWEIRFSDQFTITSGSGNELNSDSISKMKI